MRIIEGKEISEALARLNRRTTRDDSRVESVVRRIVKDVRREGDQALRRYASELDRFPLREPLRIPKKRLLRAWQETPASLQRALRFAAKNIRQFAEWQKPREWRRNILPGVTVGQLVRPLDSVGCYVPSGRYPLPSALLMTVIPAQVAGVRRIAVVSPRPARETLAAAALLEVDEFYCVGGAQAIAALAYGTRTLPRVDKIVGPGNAYVTAAKKLVSFDCSIDMLAGPTEALIYSEDDAWVPWIAADLVAQAEHDVAATSLFITTRRRVAEKLQREVARLARDNATAKRALRRSGTIMIAASREQAIETINRISSEHVTLMRADDLPDIQNGGSIFVGPYAAQPLGDYCTGPNHVLPTGGNARWRGGLTVCDFVKVISVQQISRNGARALSSPAIALAEAEGLRAHATAIRFRGAKPARNRIYV